ncbi:uncharacterized protein A1O5_04049 [Cladophialophora psammophila CBS 110553]|uniref:Uncharacterized protein n=1 Tax=Cladophialophora psammophila CBS 110553 TaxID=1182543 RepID=W9X7M3_9EURO|nr:uncharacterized protein A1O5_04049 [Cladophialophora psammophila CBS 110553]EXJ72901.1 hypothetical protein A1O5_04049 [Cladophialophora psammophila CBS 110553]
MPVASSDGRAIQYHCQRPLEDTDSHLLPVRWGEIPASLAPIQPKDVKDVEPHEGVITGERRGRTEKAQGEAHAPFSAKELCSRIGMIKLIDLLRSGKDQKSSGKTGVSVAK